MTLPDPLDLDAHLEELQELSMLEYAAAEGLACVLCYGLAYPLGQYGPLLWLRCRACGFTQSREAIA